ncbi:hypothetical protein OS42_46060 [Dickeya oryzae]
MDALVNRSRRTPNLKNRTDDATEQAIVDYAAVFPAHCKYPCKLNHSLLEIFRHTDYVP